MSSAFLFCNPATLLGNTPLAFGYMPVRLLEVREVVHHHVT